MTETTHYEDMYVIIPHAWHAKCRNCAATTYREQTKAYVFGVRVGARDIMLARCRARAPPCPSPPASA